MTPKSIQGFLDIIRNKPGDEPGMPGTKLTKTVKASMIRQYLREQFAERLRELEYEEVEVLEKVFDDAWEKMYQYLVHMVIFVYEEDALNIGQTEPVYPAPKFNIKTANFGKIVKEDMRTARLIEAYGDAFKRMEENKRTRRGVKPA
jgi:hypothetical protein